MRMFRALAVVGVVAAGAAVGVACGNDDDGNAVRLRAEGGLEASLVDSGLDANAEGGSTCGIALPATYDSPDYDTNAATELAIRAQFDAFLKPMRDAENDLADGGLPTSPVTRAQLSALYGAGSPSVRSITTPFFQGKVDAWLQEYEDAFSDGTWFPTDPPAAGDKGGTYGRWFFNAHGIDLHQALEKGTYTAGFYNHALSLVASGTLTTATIDRLVAAFGAHPSFPGDPAAAQNRDINSASYAARRSKDPGLTGPYPRIRSALIKARASIAAGAKCNADRDSALKTFFSEWERSNYATVIFDFNDVINKKLGVARPDYPAALHSYGECLGFIAGFRTVAQNRRIITDAQIDELLTDALAPPGGDVTAYKLQTSSVQAAASLQQVMTKVQAIYGFTPQEVASFKNFN